MATLAPGLEDRCHVISSAATSGPPSAPDRVSLLDVGSVAKLLVMLRGAIVQSCPPACSLQQYGMQCV